MEGKLRHAVAQKLKRDSKICAAQETLLQSDIRQSVRLLAEADIAEAEADIPVWEMNLKAAEMELQDILDLMSELEPLRKYSHLPVLEATEACQREEWLLELQGRVENFLLSGGTIPADHLNTMRCHPDFETRLVPHIEKTMAALASRTSVGESLLLLAPSLPMLAQNESQK